MLARKCERWEPIEQFSNLYSLFLCCRYYTCSPQITVCGLDSEEYLDPHIITGGVIRVKNFDTAVALQDNFPPDRIRDLRLTAAKFDTDYVVVSWTAPGDDATYGKGGCSFG